VTRSGRLVPGWVLALAAVAVTGTAVTAGMAGYSAGRAAVGFAALLEEAFTPSGPALPPRWNGEEDVLPG
jgi:hypothetical protein